MSERDMRVQLRGWSRMSLALIRATLAGGLPSDVRTAYTHGGCKKSGCSFPAMTSIDGTPYEADEAEIERLQQLGIRIAEMRKVGKLDAKVLRHLRTYFRIKSIYHSNAIEGNQLNIGETRMVVEQGLTITGSR
jgi:hypothetical protein